MAKRIIESFIDDIDGKEATGTARFALDGLAYEIDLSDQNRQKLEKALAPFITKARPVRTPRNPRRVRASSGNAPALSREKSAEIRQWAKSQNLEINERGRIPAGVVQKYEAAH
ncbi:histone-like nucleoid-structuring protein Lsr2 [Nonomuraea sp. SBT364]|uniref:histone-like nucleoid-structuring protein Lsr2 n=1 Tax=Nonomuraea sp. SBT364 TaxID=1580530 RepID=UPI00066BFA11|nr:Lsr2 family protein [Nonomuraea sp. SBT364]